MTTPCLEIIRAFFTNTSIRGFNRIVKTNSLFLQFLWILFVVSTITFLVVSVFKVVIDYKQYSVNIQTYIQIDNATPFPAVTFCNHQPFSVNAYKLWNESKVMSPTKFNELLRMSAQKQFKTLFRENHFPSQEDFTDPIFISAYLDKIAIYYQNLPVNATNQLGHDESIIKNCMWSYDQIMAFDNRCEDDMLQVKLFSHPLYFNCLTVEAKPAYVSLLSKLSLIIWLGPDENTNIQYRQGFLFDIFEQAYGLRVVIHEPGSYPNIESEGVQIEPGRLNELSYQPVLHVKVDTDRKPCIDEPQTKYKDLQNSFNYDIDLCFNMVLQKLLIERCKCIYGYFPRYIDPNEQLPYCGFFDPEKLVELRERSHCVAKLFEESVQIKSDLKSSKKCIHKCKSIEYETTTSVTKWRPTDWQFYWLKEIVARWVLFQDFYIKLFGKTRLYNTKNLSSDDVNRLYNLSSKIDDFLIRKNLSQSIPGHEKLTFNDRYTFIAIKRKANNTFIKEERLVLTFNALVSRVGGLCSLYIGLTFAFFIELIDFLYTVVFLRNESTVKQKNRNRGRKDSDHCDRDLKNSNITTNEGRLLTHCNPLTGDKDNKNSQPVPPYWNFHYQNESQRDMTRRSDAGIDNAIVTCNELPYTQAN